MSTLTPACTPSWCISEESLRRYVKHASENCIQELLLASMSNNNNKSRHENDDDGWKIVSRDHEVGVEISKRGLSGSVNILRSRWVLHSVSPEQFFSVATAIDAAKEWDGDLVEARYIKEIDKDLSVIRLKYGNDSKPLFKNREFIVYERRHFLDNGTLVVAVASLPKKIAAGLYPKQKHNKTIRGFLLQSGWVVDKFKDNSCIVTYVLQLDPAGWAPKFIINRLNTKLVMIIDNLRKLVQTNPIDDAI